MMEQADTGEGHGDAIAVAGGDDMVVADAAAGLSHILHTRLVGAFDVITEGEEGVRAKAYAGVAGYPGSFLLTCERFGAFGEELLPGAVGEDIVMIVGDVDVDGVVAISTTDAGHERQAHHLGMLTQPPNVGLLTGEARAVDAALLSGTDTDGLPVLDVADAVALRVLERDEGDDQVTTLVLGEVLGHGGDVGKERGIVEADLIAALFEGDAEHLLALDGLGAVGRIDLDDVVRALPLLAKDLECLIGVGRCDDTVADLTLDEEGCGTVAGVGEGDEVAVGTHAVSTAGTSIGRGDRRELEVDIVDPVDLAQRVAEGESNGSTGRRDMLEGGGGRKSRSRLQLADKLPGIEGIEEIDVARTAAKHLDGQFATVGHEDARRFLVRVAPVFELKFSHVMMIMIYKMDNLLEVGPVVGAEGADGETRGGDKVAGRIVGPSITDSYRARNLGCFDDDTLHESLALGVSLGYIPAMVGAGNGEALDVGIGSDVVAAPRGTEREDGTRCFDAHLIEVGSGTEDIVAVGAVECQQGETSAHLLLVLGMDVASHAYVDVDSHAHAVKLEGFTLCLADGSPAGFGL